jgi:hypothetical protein
MTMKKGDMNKAMGIVASFKSTMYGYTSEQSIRRCTPRRKRGLKVKRKLKTHPWPEQRQHIEDIGNVKDAEFASPEPQNGIPRR